MDYSSTITQIAQQYGVDPSLALAVANQESGGQQYNSSGGVLTSSAGAQGIFQLMPSTAAGLGVDPTDPVQNIQGGIEYLSQMLSQFGGNVQLALAAYNAGPGAVTAAGGVPPYTETQNYVSSIMSQLGLSPGSFLPVPPHPRVTEPTA
jgi:soluble lytic murein transglycosylase-like protein